MRALRALLLPGLVALSLLGAIGSADAVEAQKADPEKCDTDDKACIEAWYKEYSSGLLAEFKYYVGQEDFLAEMMASPQATLLTAKLSLLLLEGGTRYSQWAPLKDETAAKDAGLDMARYQAIVGPCRDAISGMRTALFDLRQHPEHVRVAAVQYVKDATACEKAFALAAKPSTLRSKGSPMEITPQKPKR